MAVTDTFFLHGSLDNRVGSSGFGGVYLCA
jgi:hypothetical protein